MEKTFSRAAGSEAEPIEKSTGEWNQNIEFANTSRRGRGIDSTDCKRGGEYLEKKCMGPSETSLSSVTGWLLESKH